MMLILYQELTRQVILTEQKLHSIVEYKDKNKSIMKKYICTVCQWVYDPEIGDPEQGIEPGVAFENLPDDYVCPLCGVGKDEFEVEE